MTSSTFRFCATALTVLLLAFVVPTTVDAAAAKVLWTLTGLGNKRGKTVNPNYYHRLLGDEHGPLIFAEGKERPKGQEYSHPTIRGIDRTTGTFAWKYSPHYPSGDHQQGPIALGASNVVFTDYNYSASADVPTTYVTAVSRATGIVNWTYQVSSPATGNTVGVPAVVNGTVYASVSDAFMALDEATGTLLWRSTCASSNYVKNEPVVVAGLVVTRCNWNVVAFSASTGAVSWTISNVSIWSIIVSPDQTELIMESGERIVGYSVATGTLLWQSAKLPKVQFFSRLAAAPNLLVRSESANQYQSVAGRNISSGEVVWQFNSFTIYFISLPTVSGNHVFATAPLQNIAENLPQTGGLFKINLETGVGSTVVKIPAPHKWWNMDQSGPPLVIGDIVYFMVGFSQDMMVVAVSGAA